MSGDMTNLVKQLISSDHVVIFAKKSCPYCILAKECFDNINQKYTTIDLDDRSDAESLKIVLGEITGAKSVPRVFVNGNFIGGGSDVKKMLDSGELSILVQK